MSLIAKLVNLHRVDSQARGLRSRLETAQRHVASQEKLLSTLSRQRQELEAQRKQIAARAAALELEAQGVDERLGRLRGELDLSQTPKAYNALLSEVNGLKQDRSSLDDRILAEMEQGEKLKAESERVEASIAERQRLRDHASKELAEREGEVSDRLDALDRERAVAAQGIPEVTLVLFKKLGDMHEGDALAPIEEVDRRNREYSCGACNMHLPFESYSRLSAPGGAVVQCSSCHRILYLTQDVAAPSEKMPSAKSLTTKARAARQTLKDSEASAAAVKTASAATGSAEATSAGGTTSAGAGSE